MRNNPLMLWLVGVVVLLTGCMTEQRVVRDTWGDFANDWQAGGGGVYRGGQRAGGTTTGAQQDVALYTVWLGDFEGENRVKDAYAAATWLRGQANIVDVWLSEADARTSVYAGKYARPNARAAERTLREVKKIKRGDVTPYADAKIIPLRAVNETPSSPLDLRGYRGSYTLQVGFFDHAYDGDRRRAAEDRARQLREQDDVEAFFYHGVNRSMVTVGLFTRADFVRQGQGDAYGPRIRAAQERYPHNLANGNPFQETDIHGKTQDTLQASSVVRVP